MQTIGILGGMGSYATCDIFHRILDAFPVKKEWERPRILIDNRCTMPSRVRAILYGENEAQLVREMSESVEYLASAGADYIFLGCMTAHYFRPRLPHQEKILDVQELTRKWMEKTYKTGANVCCLCTEGSLTTGIWEKSLPGFQLTYPNEQGMIELREYIEVVKQNRVTPQVQEEFRKYAYMSCPTDGCVLLGCTELPILFGSKTTENVVDPISCVIQYLKEYV